MHILSRTILFSLSTVLGILPPSLPAADEAAERREVASRIQGVTAEDLSASPVPGLYQLTIGPQVFYVSTDGRYLLRGDLIDLQTNGNLTEARRAGARLEALDAVGEAQMVVFQPEGRQEHVLNVFTDVSCSYCRRFHAEIDRYLEAGVEVRYLFYPRKGPRSGDWETSRRVWCSEDRQSALTRAKQDQPVEAARCADDPVASHYQLGRAMGVTGTPSIITGRGELIPGFLPFDRMMERLEQGAQTAAGG